MANKAFHNALKCNIQKTPPVWFMRQAGRYHHHYQSLKKEHSFEELCRNPKLAAQVALGPIEDFDFDVAILFSDLLFPLDAMGMGLSYTQSGPSLKWQLDKGNLSKLHDIDKLNDKLDFQKHALIETRALLPDDKSLIGFVGGPWTLFSYAVEGKHQGGLVETKKNLNLFPHFCEVLYPILVHNIELQLKGGAEIIMIFDTAAGELAPNIYKALVVPELEKIIKGFPHKLAYFAKGLNEAHLNCSLFSKDSLAGMGYDHRWQIQDLIQKNKHGFIQGNFDPALLLLEPKTFKKYLIDYLKPITSLAPEQRRGYICSLGHGILPPTPEENVGTFVQTLRELCSE